MSNTKRDNVKVKIDQFYKDKYAEWKKCEPPQAPNYEFLHFLGLREDDLQIQWKKYAKGTNRFHYLHTTRPNRRKENIALRKITLLKDYEDWDAYELPINRRPKEYWL